MSDVRTIRHTDELCERAYFDRQSILQQLLEGAGPLTWLRTLIALRRQRRATGAST